MRDAGIEDVDAPAGREALDLDVVALGGEAVAAAAFARRAAPLAFPAFRARARRCSGVSCAIRAFPPREAFFRISSRSDWEPEAPGA